MIVSDRWAFNSVSTMMAFHPIFFLCRRMRISFIAKNRKAVANPTESPFESFLSPIHFGRSAKAIEPPHSMANTMVEVRIPTLFLQKMLTFFRVA